MAGPYAEILSVGRKGKDMSFDQTLCLRPLKPEIVSGCVLVWKKNHVLPPALTRFIDYMKTSLALPTEGKRGEYDNRGSK